MKTFLKYLLYVIGGIALLAGLFVVFLEIRGVPKYEPMKIDLKVASTPERVARGKKIVGMLCAGCHLSPTTNTLTGKRMEDIPEKFGAIHSRNITQDKEKGIGTWTDGEIAYLLRTGVKRDGNFVPVMSGLQRMADEDLESVIAFLRSDDPLVRANPTEDVDSDYGLFTKFLCLVAFKAGEYPTTKIMAPDPSNKLAYGKYLTLDLVGCDACHAGDFADVNFVEPEKTPGFFGGGNALLDNNGKTVYSRNLTPDKATGIGSWTEEQFMRAVRDGFRPDNTPLRYPMERYVTLTGEEVSAIYAYLRTVPAIAHEIPASETLVASASTAATGPGHGKESYYKYACYSCHGETGIGNCDLRGADKKYLSDDSLIAWIRDPSQFVPDSKMPTWNGVIKEEEYGPLAEYVRELGRMSTQTKPIARR